jgi:hypothetical protein
MNKVWSGKVLPVKDLSWKKWEGGKSWYVWKLLHNVHIGLLSGLYRVQNLSFIFAAERGEELKTLKLQLNASARTRRVTGTDRKRKYRK